MFFLDYTFVQYFPLQLFVLLFNFGYDWWYAFIFSGICSVLFLLLLLYRKKIIDRFVLAIYCFLIAGAVMYVGKVPFLEHSYEFFEESMLLLWMFIIGTISTFATSAGFIGIDTDNIKKSRLYSIYLLCATLLTLIISLFFRGNLLLAGTLPFIALKFLQIKLQKKLKMMNQ